MRLVTFRTLSMMAVLVGMAGLAQPASAAPIQIGEGGVGGSLSDWGITLSSTNSQTNWAGQNASTIFPVAGPGLVNNGVPTHPLPQRRANYNGFSYNYVLEDTSDTATSGGGVGPNAGGQNYDMEFLGAGFDSGRLVIGVASGQRPDNTPINSSSPNFSTTFSPGDIRIKITGTQNLSYGVEVGGGVAGGGAITEASGAGTTYNLETDGTTRGGWQSDAATNFGTTTGGAGGSNFTLEGNIAFAKASVDAVTAATGAIWANPRWILDPFDTTNTGDVFRPVQMLESALGTDYVGLADYYFSRNDETTNHSIIELAIDLEDLLGVLPNNQSYNYTFEIGWAPSCGNDIGDMSVLLNFDPQITETPEPTSMLLTGLGALGFIGFRRRQRAKTAA